MEIKESGSLNSTYGLVVPSGTNVTFNGLSVIYNYDQNELGCNGDKRFKLVDVHGTLTVKGDSIVSVCAKQCSDPIYVDSGTLNIAGNAQILTDENESWSHCINARGTGALNISGGTIRGGLYTVNLAASSNIDVNITGGVFKTYGYMVFADTGSTGSYSVTGNTKFYTRTTNSRSLFYMPANATMAGSSITLFDVQIFSNKNADISLPFDGTHVNSSDPLSESGVFGLCVDNAGYGQIQINAGLPNGMHFVMAKDECFTKFFSNTARLSAMIGEFEDGEDKTIYTDALNTTALPAAPTAPQLTADTNNGYQKYSGTLSWTPPTADASVGFVGFLAYWSADGTANGTKICSTSGSSFVMTNVTVPEGAKYILIYSHNANGNSTTCANLDIQSADKYVANKLAGTVSYPDITGLPKTKMNNLTVKLYSNNVLKKTATTDDDGKYSFDVVDGTYDIVIDAIPNISKELKASVTVNGADINSNDITPTKADVVPDAFITSSSDKTKYLVNKGATEYDTLSAALATLNGVTTSTKIYLGSPDGTPLTVTREKLTDARTKNALSSATYLGKAYIQGTPGTIGFLIPDDKDVSFGNLNITADNITNTEIVNVDAEGVVSSNSKGGILHISDGCSITVSSANSNAINVSEGAELYITGGSITASGSGSSCVFADSGDSSVTVSDGTLTGYYGILTRCFEKDIPAFAGTVTISDDASITGAKYGIDMEGSGLLKMSSGTVACVASEGIKPLDCAAIIFNTNTTINVGNDGSITAAGANITGGTITTDGMVAVTCSGVVNISGGSITAKEAPVYQINTGRTTISGEAKLYSTNTNLTYGTLIVDYSKAEGSMYVDMFGAKIYSSVYGMTMVRGAPDGNNHSINKDNYLNAAASAYTTAKGKLFQCFTSDIEKTKSIGNSGSAISSLLSGNTAKTIYMKYESDPKSLATPTDIEFTDTEEMTGRIGGTLKWKAPVTNGGSSYSIYWSKSTSELLTDSGKNLIAVKTGITDIKYDLSSLKIPTGANGLAVCCGNGLGDNTDGFAYIAISDVAKPSVVSVTSTADDVSYKSGTTIYIMVKFSQDVEVDTTGGKPTLKLGSGGTAVYDSMDDNDILRFVYKVADGDYSDKFDYADNSSLSLNGGTIKTVASQPVDVLLRLPEPGTDGSLSYNRNIKITAANSALDKSSVSIDKSDLGKSDIVITLDLKGNKLTSISDGQKTLKTDQIKDEDNDYLPLTGGKIKITASYLSKLTATTSLTFNFNSGKAQTLTITINNDSTLFIDTKNSGTGSKIVEVNGEKKDAGVSSTVTTSTGQKLETIKVDDTKLDKLLQSSGDKPTVTLPANNGSNVVVGELNGQTVKNMEKKEAVLEIKTETVTYTLPATQINIDSVSSQIGSQVELKDIKVSVKIAEPSADTVKIVADTASKGNYQVVVKPVEFEITCTSGTKTVEVSKFNGYVERTVAIPDGIDPSKITTGIVLNADGTFSHVPTQVIKIDGKYYAKINSLTNSTYSVIYNPVTFTDAANHWAKAAINDMGSRMVVTGVGSNNYDPDRSITRAEFAAIVVRALGLKKGTAESSFGDVSASDWFNGYVDTAMEYGLITGYSATNYCPNDEITREQAMAIIARAMKLTGLKADSPDVSKILAAYSDCANVSAYAEESAAVCINTGIVSGRDSGTLAPKAYVTRAEVAVMVQRLLKKSGLI